MDLEGLLFLVPSWLFRLAGKYIKKPSLIPRLGRKEDY
jgi:hypothetical protein